MGELKMVIVDAQLNKDSALKRELEAKIEKAPGNEELKRLLKNCNERIRVRLAKLQESVPKNEVPIVQPRPKQKQFGVKRPSIKDILMKEYVDGNTNTAELAKKHGLQLTSVRWYISSFRRSDKK